MLGKVEASEAAPHPSAPLRPGWLRDSEDLKEGKKRKNIFKKMFDQPILALATLEIVLMVFRIEFFPVNPRPAVTRDPPAKPEDEKC